MFVFVLFLHHRRLHHTDTLLEMPLCLSRMTNGKRAHIYQSVDMTVITPYTGYTKQKSRCKRYAIAA